MVIIDEQKCVGCGWCAKDCIARNIIVTDGKAHVKHGCLECGHCVAICPREAIILEGYDMADVEEFDGDSFYLEPENLLHCIKFRRSIRDYRPKKVEPEVLEQILQAGRYTATAKNNQDCMFVFVQNEHETLKKMVWEYIENIGVEYGDAVPDSLKDYLAFDRRRKKNPEDDYLFRNAPVVLFISSDWPLDAGLAAQNMELMSASLGLGALYNGYLARIADANEALKKWLGIEGKTIKACMLLGYPNISYMRTAPRKEANVIWK